MIGTSLLEIPTSATLVTHFRPCSQSGANFYGQSGISFINAVGAAYSPEITLTITSFPYLLIASHTCPVQLSCDPMSHPTGFPSLSCWLRWSSSCQCMFCGGASGWGGGDSGRAELFPKGSKRWATGRLALRAGTISKRAPGSGPPAGSDTRGRQWSESSQWIQCIPKRCVCD